ncbi:MAG TPA: class I SAM-dependent methyltransferase [Terriglobia bacterium]|nr:class I SAM-dependent methyltransferase [Terriglobia bacterium]
MRWLEMNRNPEPEVMNAADDISAYASAAGQDHLDALDNTFVDRVLSLAPPGVEPTGSLLDVGCGPGNIALKVARRCRGLAVVGLDRSRNMVETARRMAAELGLENRVFFQQASADRLPFSGGAFDFVLSNSVLHHLSDPARVLGEMLRVIKPDGSILLRDLRRPSRLAYPWHVRWYGRHYSGIMKRLFEDSVRAAYTPDELADLLGRSGLSEAHIFLHERSHMGFVYRGHHS